MEKAKLISEVKNLIGNAEVEKAMDHLLEFLREDPQYRHLHNDLLQVRSQFRKAQRDESLGLASSESTKLSYSRATQQLLAILDRLESGRLGPEEAGTFEGKRPKRWYWVAGAIALLFMLAGGWYFWGRFQPEEPGEVPVADCPIDTPFRPTSEFNILLRRFQILAGEDSPRPHIIIATKLENFIKDLGIDCDFETLTDVDPDQFFSDSDAESTADRCGAHLIIWGLVEKPPATDSFNIQTHYKFVDRDSFLKVSKLELREGSEISSVSTPSIIPTASTITQSIFESIKLLFGLIAYETGDRDKAIEMLEAYQPPAGDTTANLAKGMVLGDVYLAEGQEEEAWEAYDRLLETHDYPLARNNRGILNLKKENYVEAAEDLTVFLEIKPDDTVALEARGTAYLKSEQLQKARADLQEVREMKAAPSTDLIQKLEEVERKIVEEKRSQAAAEAELNANPNNLAAWNLKASSSIKLGDYKEAVRAGEAILRRDPDNIDAFVQIIKAYRNAGDTAQVNKTIRRAVAAGVNRQEIDDQLPFKLINTSTFRPPILRN